MLLGVAAAGAAAYAVSQNMNTPEGIEYYAVGGKSYGVRKDAGKDERAEFLHQLYLRNVVLLDYLAVYHEDDERVKRLLKSTPRIREVEASSSEAGYTEDKGAAIALCLKDEDYKDKLDALYFVMLHELAHVANDEWGHGPEFWETFDFIQESAIRAGVYEYVDYSEDPVQICDFSLNQNPCETCPDL